MITPAEADAAIYIDFEGRQNDPPILLGVLYAEGRKRPDPSRVVLRHDIIAEEFAALRGAVTVRPDQYIYRYDTAHRHMWVAVAEVVRRAVNQDRVIVAWSRHEVDLIRAACASQGLGEQFSDHFRDGKATAKRWLREVHPDKAPQRAERGGAHKLGYYMALVGWEVPDEFGPGRVGAHLKRVGDALARGSGWDGLTAGQRQAWLEVVGHNMHDCLRLRAVVQRASAEVDI